MEKIENLIENPDSIKNSGNDYSSERKILELICNKFFTEKTYLGESEKVRHSKLVPNGFTDTTTINSTELIEFLSKYTNYNKEFHDLFVKFMNSYKNNHGIINKILGTIFEFKYKKIDKSVFIEIDRTTLELMCSVLEYQHFIMIYCIMKSCSRPGNIQNMNEYLHECIVSVRGYINEDYARNVSLVHTKKLKTNITTQVIKRIKVEERLTPTEYGYTLEIPFKWDYSVAI